MIEAGRDLISNDVHRLHPSPASYFNYASQGPHPMYDQHGLRNLSYYLDYCLPFFQIYLENWNIYFVVLQPLFCTSIICVCMCMCVCVCVCICMCACSQCVRLYNTPHVSITMFSSVRLYNVRKNQATTNR